MLRGSVCRRPRGRPRARRRYRDWLGVGREDTVLGIAPLYHVTGLSGHIGLAPPARRSSSRTASDPVVATRLTEQLGATVTITAYIATGSVDAAAAHDLSSLRRTYSGGAPIPPPVVEDVAVRTGMVIRPVYGLTETMGPTHLALHERETPGPCRDGSAIGRADCPGHPDPDPRRRRSGTAPARSA